jgi:NADH-quinone oxidoreductase subunit A
MPAYLLPVLLFLACAALLSCGLVLIGGALGPKRQNRVKAMPYESGMDPIHDARRRFVVRFNLVAIAFLVFDVELLFLYPWAVANKNKLGLLAVQVLEPGFKLHVVFGEVMFFVALLTAGFVYAWRRGVFRWR